MPVTISIADDHQLVRKGIRLLLENIRGFHVANESSNGKELIETLGNMPVLPDIVLIDVNMPVMEGPEAVEILRNKYPDLRMVALSVNTDLQHIRKMIEAGANAYLFKESTPEIFEKVLKEVVEKGFYYSAEVIRSLTQLTPVQEKKGREQERQETLLSRLSAREKEFIVHCCSELTYMQIADAMSVSQSTINGYRASVFDKLDIKSRTGLVIFAVNTGLISL